MLRKKRPKRHVSCQRRVERPVAAGADEIWSMEFMSDEIFNGRRITLLTIVDNFTRESLAIKVAASIKGEAVVTVLQRLMEQRRLPGPSGLTMAPSSLRNAWTNGPTLAGCNWTSVVLASPRTTPSSRHSTAGSGGNASMRTGSCPWRMPRRKWNPGGNTTMGKGPTAPWATCPPGSSPYWRNWLTDPQNAHNGWYREWGKTLPEYPATR